MFPHMVLRYPNGLKVARSKTKRTMGLQQFVRYSSMVLFATFFWTTFSPDCLKSWRCAKLCDTLPQCDTFVTSTLWFTFFFPLSLLPGVQGRLCCGRPGSQSCCSWWGVAAANRSPGLVDLSKRSEQNAERDCRRLLVGKHQLALPIPHSRLDTGDEGKDELVPVLRFRDWCEYLVNNNHTHIFCGLMKPDHRREAAILSLFWRQYRVQVPDHPVFALADTNRLNLSTCIPTILHGDEGRGRKRSAFLVMNCHSMLGRGLATSKGKDKYAKLLPNYEGHSLTSRFLFAAMPKLMYTGKREYVFHSLLALVAEECQDLLHNGVMDHLASRGTFTFALLQVSGDWPFLSDSGYMERSFRNVQKHRTNVRRKPPVGICHLCRAGQVGFDFEQINTVQPKWRPTMHTQDLHSEDWGPSPLEQVPHPPDRLGALWLFDVFHCWHLGAGKYFLSSFLAILSELQPESSVDDRLRVCPNCSWTFAWHTKKQPHVSKFPRSWLDGATTTTFPTGGWHKGALTTVLMEWVEWRFQSRRQRMARDGTACWWGRSHGQLFPSGAIQGWSLFDLPRKQACSWLGPSVSEGGMLFWHAFQLNASSACGFFNRSITHYTISPFIFFEGSFIGPLVNPICWATQQSEDFVGRPSRLARRVTPKLLQVAPRVLQRHLQASYEHFAKAGYIVRPTSKAFDGWEGSLHLRRLSNFEPCQF